MRLAVPVIIGLVGIAILVSLGTWQVRRLAWKEGVLAEIETRIAADPVALPDRVTEGRDTYLPVTVEGVSDGAGLHVLVSTRQIGAAYRIVRAMTLTDGRRVLVDLGLVPAAEKPAVAQAESLTVTGNLHWPDEVDGYTPEPDLEDNIWFARDVPAMAAALGTEEVLVVAREVTGGAAGITPRPVGTEGIPNDHLQYALTWFGLAIVWAGMTALWLWRIARGARREMP